MLGWTVPCYYSINRRKDIHGIYFLVTTIHYFYCLWDVSTYPLLMKTGLLTKK